MSEIESAGGTAIPYKADITNSSQVDAMIDAIMQTFGRIDILVNNAGLSIDSPFLEINEEDWDRVYAVNLKGSFLISQRVARRMMDGEVGVIINISATTTTQGRPNAGNYCSSKTLSTGINYGP